MGYPGRIGFRYNGKLEDLAGLNIPAGVRHVESENGVKFFARYKDEEEKTIVSNKIRRVLDQVKEIDSSKLPE